MIELQAIGNIGRDAVQRTAGGRNYASFSLAVTERRQDGGANTVWLDVMRQDAEGRLTPYLKKGTKLFVKGRPSFSTYTDRSGTPVPDVTVWADRVEFLSPGANREQGTARETPDDDLPF